jgi:DNA (cytosine-5)-methyltransferase 1
VETYRTRFPGVPVHHGDIRAVEFARFRGVDIVAGGPPCQPFSVGGLRKAAEDCRDFLPEFVRAVVEIQPEIFVMENVPGLISFTPYLKTVLEPVAVQYRLSFQVVDAADFGVPQSRKRLLIVGTRSGADFQLHPLGRVRVPAGAVLGPDPMGVPNHSKITYAKRPDLRPNPYHGHLFNGGGRAIDLEKPSPTILASAGGNKTHFLDMEDCVPNYHRHLLMGGSPRVGELPGARRITVQESAALQTFPRDMFFAGKISSQYKQVGNAVPPMLAQIVAEEVQEILVGKSRRKAVAA